MSVRLDGFVLLLFDTAEERDLYYYQTVGDDGPTKTNPYRGKATVYAATISPEGKTMAENT